MRFDDFIRKNWSKTVPQDCTSKNVFGLDCLETNKMDCDWCLSCVEFDKISLKYEKLYRRRILSE